MHTQNMKITQKHENTQKMCRTDAHDVHWYSPRFKKFSGTSTQSQRDVQDTKSHAFASRSGPYLSSCYHLIIMMSQEVNFGIEAPNFFGLHSRSIAKYPSHSIISSSENHKHLIQFFPEYHSGTHLIQLSPVAPVHGSKERPGFEDRDR